MNELNTARKNMGRCCRSGLRHRVGDEGQAQQAALTRTANSTSGAQPRSPGRPTWEVAERDGVLAGVARGVAARDEAEAQDLL